MVDLKSCHAFLTLLVKPSLRTLMLVQTVNPRGPAKSLVISCAFSMPLLGEGGIKMVLDCGHALESLGSFVGVVVFSTKHDGTHL